MFQKGITLENFSVRVTQLLAFSLGIHLDNSSHCQCSGSICIMNPSAIQSDGSKFFSSCSLKDYQSFLRHGDIHCLTNKPRMDFQLRAPFCGNKIVEQGEQCDCGTQEV
ncbi:hypothetical protein lerEdw1_012707 [Lerista edwardsae]|nr:hypothetical protein lerEdw1_012707 [Lerista edwardsae]